MTELPGASSNQALARGLHVLRALVDEGAPLTATELGRRFGLHQSSISRTLATLTELGYVRKAANGRFVPDFGVLSLSSAISRFPITTKPRQAIEEIAAELVGYTIHLCMLWHGEQIYLLRTSKGLETLSYWGPGFPLHVSSPGLRLLLEIDEAEALGHLRTSRERYGWRGDPAHVSATEEEILAKARSMIEHDVLILDGWYQPDVVGGAIPLQTSEDHPVALAITGPVEGTDNATLRLWLHDARRRVEAALA